MSETEIRRWRMDDMVGMSLLIGEQYAEETSFTSRVDLRKPLSLAQLRTGVRNLMRGEVVLRGLLEREGNDWSWRELVLAGDLEGLSALARDIVEDVPAGWDPGSATGMRQARLPLWRVRREGGQILHLTVHHAMVDGLGSLHLLDALLAEVQRPDPDGEPLAWPCDARKETGTKKTNTLTQGPLPRALELLTRAGSAASHLLRDAALAALAPAAMLGTLMRAPEARQHATFRECTDESIRDFRRKLSAGAYDALPNGRVPTANDLLLASFATALEAHLRRNPRNAGDPNADAKRIAFMHPIDLRDAHGAHQRLGNRIGFLRISLRREQLADAHLALREVMGETESMDRKKARSGSFALTSFSLGGGARKRVFAAYDKPLGNNAWRMEHTALYTNVGRIRIAMDKMVEAIRATAPIRAPMGLSLAVTTLHGRVHLGFRGSEASLGSEELEKVADETMRLLGDLLARG